MKPRHGIIVLCAGALAAAPQALAQFPSEVAAQMESVLAGNWARTSSFGELPSEAEARAALVSCMAQEPVQAEPADTAQTEDEAPADDVEADDADAEVAAETEDGEAAETEEANAEGEDANEDADAEAASAEEAAAAAQAALDEEAAAEAARAAAIAELAVSPPPGLEDNALGLFPGLNIFRAGREWYFVTRNGGGADADDRYIKVSLDWNPTPQGLRIRVAQTDAWFDFGGRWAWSSAEGEERDVYSGIWGEILIGRTLIAGAEHNLAITTEVDRALVNMGGEMLQLLGFNPVTKRTYIKCPG